MKKKRNGTQQIKKHSLCWTCLRSRPIPGIGCSWSRLYHPVKGWDAEATTIKSTRKSGTITYGSYRVCACPLYIEERNVQTNDFTFEEQRA
ncbi:MAG: hypothetical protein CVV04_11925 [Firmicutes bacterium HGW-Firmicutes-9]|jgi:hypothetical protein|nr:MAG: hypothetical protein CVV04_11925 [Firmicutes bacterium HGW-Firmicutes-9]